MAESGPGSFGYEQTLMYGRYTKELGEYARQEAAKIDIKKKELQEERKKFGYFFPCSWRPRCPACCVKTKRWLIYARNALFTKIGEDWIFLTFLGIIMALLSFIMDFIIQKCQIAHIWLYRELELSAVLQYFAWVIFPVVFVIFSTGFVHLVAPNAIGSGIPEMKTIMRGVVLKEYLTFKTLIAKMVGLCTSLGSSLPIGKEGPFVHVASIVATLLSKMITSFHGIFENESRNHEMLAAACAVGVACTFAAPIGGVLFSIEVTASYFAVHNYWRGFYSAVCGAITFRLLAIWFSDEATIAALFKTHLRHEFPFDPVELLAFAFIGIVCGLGGALYVYLHRRIIYFNRKHKRMSAFLQKNRFLYPTLVTFLITSLTFPLGLGQFMGGELTYHRAIDMLFSNFTWIGADTKMMTLGEREIIRYWSPEHSHIFVTLTLFIIHQFWASALANTLPIPTGLFIPVFTTGAAFGRLTGECMAAWFPKGIQTGDKISLVMPGGYAVVGAAALSGSVTHTISTSVIVFELTGQISHILPAVIAVLISNAIAHTLQPSIYDSIIQIKKLPFLPDIVTKGGASNAYNIFVEDIMVRDVKYVSYASTYLHIQNLLRYTNVRAFPLVDSAKSMILLGSVQRAELVRLLEEHLGHDRRRLDVSQTSQGQRIYDVGDDIHSEAAPVDKPFEEAELMRSIQAIIPTICVPDIPPNLQAPQQALIKSRSVPTLMITPANETPTTPPTASRSHLSAFFPRDFKYRSHSSVGSAPSVSSIESSNYDTVHSISSAHELLSKVPKKSILKKSPASTPQTRSPEGSPPSERRFATLSVSNDDTIGSGEGSPRIKRKLKLPPPRVVDMTPEDQTRWEQQQLRQTVNFDMCQIDPAPFQLVERTSLFKVHSLFALLSLNHAYVTNTGRLVGVVALKEVRLAVQGATQTMYEGEKNNTQDDPDGSLSTPLNIQEESGD
ncbi:chloride channel protein 2-like isoform X2 [Lineus longissimus]|uniref:chloride channel protein 2-like isoform X2 n=1 Tax=Lineus longissimus TaxID=88925 RepID=UPI00315C87F4